MDPEQLLAPDPRAPVNLKAFRFEPYSGKLHRTLFLTGPGAHDLWVHLESDPDIEVFNERAPSCRLDAPRADKSKGHRPDMVSRSRSGALSIHLIRRDTAEGAGLEVDQGLRAWQAWARLNGCALELWPVSRLRRNEVELRSLRVLIKWVAFPGAARNGEHEASVLQVVAQRRSSTLAAVIRECTGWMSDEDAIRAWAALVLDRRLQSDIDRHPVSQLTETWTPSP